MPHHHLVLRRSWNAVIPKQILSWWPIQQVHAVTPLRRARRDYYETQNYFESRVTPEASAIARIHATPAYPVTVVAGITLHFGAK
jgi:hypothetical protein